jgi:transcriptional regulator with XRE-family HTH domain
MVGESKMFIGQRVKQLREQKGLSQGDVEKFSGMLRTYISRVENGHSVPSLDTLERFATALDIPLYQLFCETEGSTPRDGARERFGPNGSEDRFLSQLKGLATRMADSDRTLLLDFASRLASRRRDGEALLSDG